MTRICVFTGAGMSSPLGLPTTSEFINAINRIENGLLQQIKSFLKNPDSNDIEQVMYLIEDFVNNSDFTHHIIRQGLNINGFSNVNTHIESYKSQAKAALDLIRGEIYENLMRYDESKAMNLFSNLISELQDTFKEAAISIFTSNYDLSFENGFADNEKIIIGLGINKIEYGFSVNGIGTKATYNATEDYAWKENIIEYRKLHGSLDWQWDIRGIECIRVGVPLNPKNPGIMPILYPGYKGIPNRQPFIDIHEKFDKRLNDADVVIVIGFAFRDDYINNIFEYALKRNQNLVLLCYNPCTEENIQSDSKLFQFANKYPINFFHIPHGVSIMENPLKLTEVIGQKKIMQQFTN